MALLEHTPVRAPGAPPGSSRTDLATARGKPSNPRDVPGEELVKNVGGKVPNYNMFGHQHHRLPFKNKEAYLGIKQLPEWNKKVEYRTRTELMQARKAEQIPDMSYDLDGDGVVDQRDYFYGKLFDKDHNGLLTKEERSKAVKALNNNYSDNFLFGYDTHGVMRPYPIQQKRGRILTVDNWDELGETYPPHSISHIVPKHKTRTELSLDRLGDRKNSAYKMKVKWDERHPYYVPEAPSHQENWVENPVITSIGQRANADNQAARVAAGLYPAPTYENPERQNKMPSLKWVEDPVFQTRGQILETRKELMKRDLDEQRMRGEMTYVPMTVRRAQQEEQEYQFRRGHMDNMTKTRLEDYRKKERVEYDMAHFGLRHKEHPRYSDQPHPWWTLHQQNRHMSAPSLVTHAQAAEPDFKVTETRPDVKPIPKPERMPVGEMVLAEAPELERKEPGVKTVKRWTTDLIEHNQLRNKPRLFDQITEAARKQKTFAKDFAPLENYSSFEWTRNQSLRQQAEARRRNSERVPKSKLDPVQFADHEKGAVSTVSYDQLSSHTTKSRGQISRPRSATMSSAPDLRRTVASRGPTYDPPMPARIASRSRSGLGSELMSGDATRMSHSASAPNLAATAFSVRTGGFNRIDMKDTGAHQARAA